MKANQKKHEKRLNERKNCDTKVNLFYSNLNFL